MAYEPRGVEYLRNKLIEKQARVLTRYKFYEMKNCVRDFNISSPPNLRYWNSVLGWCGKSVDVLADRLVFREFRGDNFNLNEIFKMNNPDNFADSAILSALIASCCFVYISADDIGFPRLQVIDGGNATGCIDPITGLLNEGYAVLDRDEHGLPTLEAYFLPSVTEYYVNGKYDAPADRYEHNVDYPLLVPIVYRPDAVRPFGHSRISRACMSIMESALRTIKRGEISAEFYSFPQKWISGLAEDAEIDSWKASMSSFIALTKDDDGDAPKVGQFTQQSMQPHTDQLKMFAALFAGETGLTLDDLGFATDNPSSAEAIKAAHENLRLTARKAQRNFGSGLLNVGFLSACLRDDYAYERKQLYLTHAAWEPVFEPDAAAMSGIGDAIIKVNQAVPGYFDKTNLRDLTGIEGGDLIG